jgi:hypothetical protein
MRILMTRLTGIFVACLTGALLSLPAAAVQWTSTSGVSPGGQDGGACSAPASNPPGCEQFIVTSDGQELKVRAYSVSSIANSQTSPLPTGNWITAEMLNYGTSGFAIKNRVGTTVNGVPYGSGPADSGECCQPEHAVDNNEVIDVLVFELPQGQNWDIDAFRLGWAREGSDPSTAPQRADVQLWFGGSALGANYDFTEVCFTGCTGAAKTLTGAGPAGLGFVDITSSLSHSNGTGGENVAQGATVSVNSTQAGRYLVMTGQLGESNDHFKVNLLKATGTTVPAPGTLALLGLGFAGFLLRRRAVRT